MKDDARSGRNGERLQLVPRLADQGYGAGEVDARRRWVEETCGVSLETVGRHAFDTEQLRGNIENPIGAVQMPLGVAGPLKVMGEHAQGAFYVPLATTEGALVRSYERGMAAISRSGGASVRIWRDENRIAPVLFFPDLAAAAQFVEALPECFEKLAALTGETTRHGKLRRVDARIAGRRVHLELGFFTGDAQGMNMIALAADHICKWLVRHRGVERYLIFSGAGSEKRASASLFAPGKGKRVTAMARLPRQVLRSMLRVDAEAMAEIFRRTAVGHMQAGAFGVNAHIANGLTALFIACGQDVANVVNSAVGITELEADGHDLVASCDLFSLTVATVGGGTALGTSAECLRMLGCEGSGKAAKLAEIAAATVLAGEISMSAAIAAGEFVAAHEKLGRNRPTPEQKPDTDSDRATTASRPDHAE